MQSADPFALKVEREHVNTSDVNGTLTDPNDFTGNLIVIIVSKTYALIRSSICIF